MAGIHLSILVIVKEKAYQSSLIKERTNMARRFNYVHYELLAAL